MGNSYDKSEDSSRSMNVHNKVGMSDESIVE